MNKLKVAIVGTVYPTGAQARCSKPEREPSVRAHMLYPHKVLTFPVKSLEQVANIHKGRAILTNRAKVLGYQ